MRPEALLLDEPTNGLDPEARLRIIDVLKSLPTARIIISHDWDFLAETSTGYLTVAGGRDVYKRQDRKGSCCGMILFSCPRCGRGRAEARHAAGKPSAR